MKSRKDKKNNEVEILIVEDSPTQAMKLQHLLKQENYSVSAAQNGLEALSFLKKHRPTLIISDVVMPEMDGFELCQKIKADENLKDIPVVLLTALTEPDDIIKGLTSGADNFVTKPYDEKTLLSSVNYILVNRDIRRKKASDMGIDIFFSGKRHFITSDRMQILDLLISTYEINVQKSRELERANKKLEKTQGELRALNEQLEQKVLERTQRISHLNKMILAVRNVNQLITKEKDLDRLLQRACNKLIEARGDYKMWIVLLDESGGFVKAFEAGLGKDFLSMIELLKRNELPDCCSKALKQPDIVVTEDPASSCNDCPMQNTEGRSGMSIRLEHHGKVYGLLSGSIPRECITDEDEQALWKEVAGDIAFALHSIELEEERKRAEEALRKRTHDLGERVKELGCLFGLSRLIEQPDVSLEEVFQGIIQLAPPAWQYPDIICSRVVFEDKEFKTDNFKNTRWKQSAEIMVSGKKAGIIEVCYLEERPELDEGPFSKEERNLLDALAERLGKFIMHKRAEEALRKSEASLAEAQRIASLGNWDWDIVNNELRWSDQIYHILGLKQEEFSVTNEAFFNSVHPEDRELVKKTIDDALAKRKPYRIDHRIILPDGEERIVHEQAEVTFDQAGKPIRMIGTIQDITEDRLAEEALRKERDLLDHIMETSPSGITMVDRVGQITFANARAEELLGLRKEEITERLYNDPKWGITDFKGNPVPEDELPFKQVLRNGLPVYDARHAIVWSDGKRVLLSINSAPLFDVSDQVTGVVNTIEDITNEVQLENQLRQAQKMESIGLLAGGVAHDFNNLLTSIMGYSSLIKKAVDLPEKQRKRIEEIVKASQRGAEITRQLLTFSRKQPLKLVKMDLNEAVSQTLRFLKRGLGPNIKIETKLDKALGIINADSTQIQQVLMNLCLNARDAMPDGGKIFIESSNIEIDAEYIAKYMYAKTGPYVLLAITDTGTGMSKETISRIFEPFFTTKEIGKGTGLGLSIVYGIVKNHGGFINVYSELGKGSSFKVYLPKVTGREEIKIVAEPLIKGGEETILIVDDEEMIFNLAASILEEYGYNCLTAGNGAEALNIYRQKHQSIDLVLMDLVMPKMSGLELFEEMRKINPRVRTALSSGFSVQDEETFYKKGINAFIPKPYQERSLAKIVREVLDSEK